MHNADFKTTLFIKWTIYCESNGNVIRPNQPSVVLTEGSSTTLSCSYDGSAYSLHWYRQKPGSKPEFLLLIVESTKYVNKPALRLTAAADKAAKSMNLTISSTEVKDSAVYYCALVPTVTGNTTTLYVWEELKILSTSVEEIKKTSLTFLHTDPDRSLNSKEIETCYSSHPFSFLSSVGSRWVFLFNSPKDIK
uniref:Ig-like domain-containing protein n=1 Tax=Sinocyclocheilus rhinocerous TaxID=307959 RepID=A0A673GUL3_9TELE